MKTADKKLRESDKVHGYNPDKGLPQRVYFEPKPEMDMEPYIVAENLLSGTDYKPMPRSKVPPELRVERPNRAQPYLIIERGPLSKSIDKLRSMLHQ